MEPVGKSEEFHAPSMYFHAPSMDFHAPSMDFHAFTDKLHAKSDKMAVVRGCKLASTGFHPISGTQIMRIE
jgi:hypothetical protein